MSSLASSQNFSTTGVKIWISLGVLGLALVVSVSASLGNMVLGERARFLICQSQGGNNCEPSTVWALYGWQSLSSSSHLPMDITKAYLDTYSIRRDNLEGPDFVSIRASGLEGSYSTSYRIKAGSTVELLAEINQAKKVEIYLVYEGSEPKFQGHASFISSMKKATSTDSLYEGEMTKTLSGFVGEIEVRATGAKNATTSLFIPFTSN